MKKLSFNDTTKYDTKKYVKTDYRENGN